MSHHFDAPKHPAAEFHSERRRSPRWSAHVPVFVYGHIAAQDPFHEEAYSAVVGDRGALLIMTTAVPVGETLLLVNKITEIERECRVVNTGHRDGPSIEIAVEFSAEAPDFWRITVPPHRASPGSPIDGYKKAL